MTTPQDHYKRVSDFLKSENFKAIKDYGAKRKKAILKDVFSCAAEYAQMQKAKPQLKKKALQGDGHSVLVIPGFTANDTFTAPLRHLLEKKGYKAHGWKGGFNMGLQEKTCKHLAARLKEVYEENGHQKISIVGHSLGGFYARALAQEFPEMVRDVITVDTPFGVGMNKNLVPAHVLTAIDKLSDAKFSIENKEMAERMLTPPPVPTTSVFSKIDMVANWQACLNPDTPLSENIEIAATHIGSLWHKDAFAIILDRLAQSEGEWKPHDKATNDKPPPNPNWKPKAADWKIFPRLEKLHI